MACGGTGIEPRTFTLSYIPFYSLFWNRVSLNCLGGVWTCDPPISGFQSAPSCLTSVFFKTSKNRCTSNVTKRRHLLGLECLCALKSHMLKSWTPGSRDFGGDYVSRVEFSEMGLVPWFKGIPESSLAPSSTGRHREKMAISEPWNDPRHTPNLPLPSPGHHSL